MPACYFCRRKTIIAYHWMFSHHPDVRSIMTCYLTDTFQRGSGPTGCLSVVALNRVVIRLSSADGSMEILSAVRHDGYYLPTLWTVRWQQCLSLRRHCSKKLSTVNHRLCLHECFCWSPVILNLPLPAAFLSLRLSRTKLLWVLLMCGLLQRQKCYRGCNSEQGLNELYSKSKLLTVGVTELQEEAGHSKNRKWRMTCLLMSWAVTLSPWHRLH